MADAGTAIHTYILASCKTVFTVRYTLGPGKLSLRASRDLVWVAVWFGRLVDSLGLVGTMQMHSPM